MHLHAIFSARTSSYHAVLLALCATLFAAFIPNRAHANGPCDALGRNCPRSLQAESARGLALGTGMRASAMSTSALAYNPAALVLGRVYHIEGLVDYMADLKTVALGGAVVDSSTSRLAAGFALRGMLSGQGGMGGIDGRLGLAFPFSDAISIGLTGRYMAVNQDQVSPTDMMLHSVRLAKGFTLDSSLRIAPLPNVQLDVSAYNLLRLSGDLAAAYAPFILGGGLAIGIADIANIGADVLVDMTSYSSAATIFGGGVEVFAGAAIPLRFGYNYDVKRIQHTLSFGIGYTDRAVGFDLSLHQDIGGFGDTRVAGAFRIYVH